MAKAAIVIVCMNNLKICFHVWIVLSNKLRFHMRSGWLLISFLRKI